MLLQILSRLALLVLLCFSVSVHAYKIDTSCKKIHDKIKAGMESAFRMAEAGEAALKNAAAMNNAEAEKDVPRDPELENLIRNLFAHKDNIEDTTPAINGKATKYNYRPTLKNMKLHRVNTILTNMRRYVKEEKANPDLNDVIIYCDSSRLNIPVNLESLKTLKSVADKDRDNIRMGTLGDALYRCATGTNAGSLAVTWGSPKDESRTYPDAIQLCKRTVDKISESKGWFGTYNENRKKRWGSGIKSYLTGKLYPFSDIDGVNLLDQTLFHEMTHARGATTPSDPTVDVSMDIVRDAYGWHLCTKLAKKDAFIDKSNPKGADNNADSIAFFAMGCMMMSDKDYPRRITDDGEIKTLDKPVKF